MCSICSSNAKCLHVFCIFQASQRELCVTQSVSVLVVGVIATVMAITVSTIYGMFIMAADIVFVIMFPQLTAVLFCSVSNAYGAITGFIIGLLLRLGAGEPMLNLKPFIYYPFYNQEQLFPYRTFSMLMSFFTILIISFFTQKLFSRHIISQKYDVLHCYKIEHIPVNEQGVESEGSSPDVGRGYKTGTHSLMDDMNDVTKL